MFAAYNAINASKKIVVLPYSGHDVPTSHAQHQLADFRRVMG